MTPFQDHIHCRLEYHKDRPWDRWTSSFTLTLDWHWHIKIFTTQYSDDTQLYYVILNQSKHTESTEQLSDCVADIQTWSSYNGLQLNSSKTEVLHVTSHVRTAQPIVHNSVVQDKITPSKTVRDLGVTFDHQLPLQQ
jgi:hypothetical protein